MSPHVVVDGSNLATEGRTLPSLAQLEEAIRSYREEHPDVEMVVVVDATFEHRVEDPKERERLKEAELHGEVVSPPAGAIGRGDAFVLKIAERTGAVVLSNDSFQEFHGEYPWLFDEGRLVGGKPVPGVGWIFTPRTPVRGPKSRAATKAAASTRAKVRRGPAPELPTTRPDGTAPKVGDVLTPVVAPELEPTPRAKVRAYELAKELGLDSKALLALAKKAKVSVASHSSSVSPEDADTLRAAAADAARIRVRELASELGKTNKEIVALAAGLGIVAKSHASALSPSDADAIRAAANPVVVEPEAPAPTDRPSRRRGRRGRGGAGGTTEDAPTTPEPAARSTGAAKAPRAKKTAQQPSSSKAKKPAAASQKPEKRSSGSSAGRAKGPVPINQPLELVSFLSSYAVGATLEATVAAFTSHGAMADVDLDGGLRFRCYIPTANLGDPPPARARDVLPKGERRQFTVTAIDAERRVAELTPA